MTPEEATAIKAIITRLRQQVLEDTATIGHLESLLPKEQKPKRPTHLLGREIKWKGKR